MSLKPKKVLLVLFALLLSVNVNAQRVVETVYLKNGSVIKGEVIEQIPGQSLKIRTRDGSIFVYPMDEVERIAKEFDVNNGPITQGHKGLDFGVDLGVNFPTESGAKPIPSMELSLGKRFSPKFYAGISAGVSIPTKSGDDPIVPIAANARVYFPLSNTKVMPLASFKVGYAINTASEDASDFLLLQVMPGVEIPVSSSVDFRFAFGYEHLIALGDGDGFGSIVVRTGFGFHKPTIPVAPVPTRSKGAQIGFETDFVDLFSVFKEGESGMAGVNVVLGYKYNPNLSFGLGLGASYATIASPEVVIGESVSGEPYSYGFAAVKGFLRGQYRLNDNRISPIASLDLGLHSYLGSDFREEDCQKGWKKTSLFVRPAIGVSIRTTNNSYLEARLGYMFTGKQKGSESIHTGTYKDVSTSGS